jgi:hypothetical protein
MSMKQITLVLALVASPTFAAAGFSSAGEVYPLADGTFEVIPQKSPATSDYWCAAGQYAIAQMSKPVGQPIYVWRSRGDSVANPGRTAVQFGFVPPPGGAVKSISNSLDIIGNSVPASLAKTYCSDRLISD